MDFSKILNLANDNKNRALEQAKLRKMAMKAKMKSNNVTSDAVKKFLERRDFEKRKQDAHEAQKRDELLSLRAAAKHTRKASAMAKRTKDNNFGNEGEPAGSVDGKTQENLRPNARDFPTRTNNVISNYVKDRQNRREVAPKQSQIKTQENHKSKMPVPQQNRNGNGKNPPPPMNNERTAMHQQPDKRRFEKKQGKINFPTKKLGASMDFNSLINLAKTKQHEPIKVPERKIEETNARLMTQAEKKRYLEEQARKLGLSVIIPGDDDKPAQNVKAIVKKQMTATKLRPEPPKLTKGPSVSSKVPLTTPISRERTVPAQSKINNAKQMLPPPRPRPASVKSLERKEFPPRDLIPVNKPRFANDTRRSEMNAVRHSKFANDSMNRQRAMNGQNERRGPPMYRSDSRPKRRFVDDDDEEDDEMDDFIDDGLGNGDEDYSKHIREIFGYDKRKYSMLDDDDCIESSFSRQMQEESYSARAGLLEDLEDIKREQEELERQYKNQKKRKLKL